MTDEEKLDLIDSLEDKEATEEHFALLCEFSHDYDAFIRSRCAAVLVHYEDTEALRLLLCLANDEDAFVRTEAYDSLALFPCRETELVLRHSLYPEDDLLAARYAILSWADVSAALHDGYGEQTEFVQKLLTDAEFADCQAEFYYALCRFGDAGALDNLLAMLDDADYVTRCSVLHRCADLVNEDNAAKIEASVRPLLQTEETAAVRSAVKSLLERLEDIQRKEKTP